jgi:hypothetical protein
MYHDAYDFLFLMPALLMVLGWQEASAHAERGISSQSAKAFGVSCLALLALALLPPIFQSESFAARALRWCARIELILLFGVVSWRLLHSAGAGAIPPMIASRYRFLFIARSVAGR